MPRPVVIDTDMGVDDAVAITLALAAGEIDVVGLVSVEGNVSLDQATGNVARLLGALQLETWPAVARGLSQQQSGLKDATQVFGTDGMGELGLPVPADFEPGDYLDLYERLIDRYGEELTIVAIGPLTNLAALMQRQPNLLSRAGQVVIMGGAVWCAGNATPHAEFNFYRDPEAAAQVLGSGLPITVVPLDVTRQVVMDESHLAHLSAGGTRSGDLLTRMIRFPMTRRTEQVAPGNFLVHDALAMGVLLWPHLFMRSKMALQITTTGEQAGRCRPAVAKDKRLQLAVAISVRVGEFIENLLEQLCHEKFVV